MREFLLSQGVPEKRSCQDRKRDDRDHARMW